MATAAPQSRRDSVIARPMPRVPPVTMAFLPSRKRSILPSLRLGGAAPGEEREEFFGISREARKRRNDFAVGVHQRVIGKGDSLEKLVLHLLVPLRRIVGA